MADEIQMFQFQNVAIDVAGESNRKSLKSDVPWPLGLSNAMVTYDRDHGHRKGCLALMTLMAW
jgi:hypothetical protein